MNTNNFQLLGAFYRRKRESLLPEELGLPKAARRSRTPGLRREDVAYLTGVSSVWYSKIERGKVQGMSTTTIESLNHVLCLTTDEMEYVHRLLQSDNTVISLPPCMRLTPYSKRVLDLLNPLPALVLNDYLDIIYANQAFALMCGININQLPVEQRNYIYLTLTNSAWCEYLNVTNTPSLFQLLIRLAGVLRSNQASLPNDQRMDDLIDKLLTLSPQFTKAWQQNTVQKSQLEQQLQHAGLKQTISFTKQILHNGSGESSGKINIYHPSHECDYERLLAIIKTNQETEH